MTDQEWRTFARKIDDEAACLVKDAPPSERVTVYFDDGDKVSFDHEQAAKIWQACEDHPQ